MHFEDSAEEAAFRREARAWLTANAKPRDPSIIMPGIFRDWPTAEEVAAARAWQRRKFDAGWARIFWPREYGGRGGTIMEQIIWDQEEARVETPPPVLFLGLGHAAYTIEQHGTPEQKAHFLPATVKGEIAWCQLFSEPGAGSDFGGLATRAERLADGRWRIDGEKIWTSDADYADYGILVTRSDDSLPKHKGMTYFLLDMHTPGVEVQNLRQISGGSHISRVLLDNVIIDDAQRLGEINNGWRVALTTLMYERFFVGASGSSGAFGGPHLEHLIQLAGRTSRNGRPAIEDAGVRQQLARFLVRARALRHMSYRVLTTVSRGQVPGPEGSLVKMGFSRLDQEVTQFALSLLGPQAAIVGDETPDGGLWQEAFLEAPGMRIAGGTDEIQLTILGERVLGLPQETVIPRDTPFREIPVAPRTP